MIFRDLARELAGMLRISNLVSGYGQTRIIDGADLYVKTGETVAILGPNGAGKTTLLRTIAGVLPTWSGTVDFNGKRLTGRPTYWIARHGIVHVLEGRGMLPNLSVRDNLLLGTYLLGRSARAKLDPIDMATDMFPWIAKRLARKTGTLSGGEQQMVAIARAIIGQPKMLMLDEPSLGLAPIIRQEVFQTISKIALQSDTSVLIVEQNAAEALRFADRAYVMQRGRLVLEGTAEDIASESRLTKAYFS